jgi:CRISPR system Cascade subunit CasA
MPDRPTFNLIEEHWIPVLRTGEHLPVERSIRQALREMKDTDRLACDPPIIEAAILRLLLAIVIDAVDDVPRSRADAEEAATEGFDLGRIDAYLDAHRDRFDLFDPVVPFGQVAGLATTKGAVKPVSLLSCTLPTGNGVPLFVPIDDADRLTFVPAEAARWLLTCQLFDGGAIKSGAIGDPVVRQGKTTGNPPAIGGQFCVTVAEGRTLADTLTVNIPYIPDGLARDDAPWWRRDPPTAAWESRRPFGILDQLTWQSRRIRLEHDQDGTVTGCVVTAGDRSEGFTESRYVEPHATLRYTKRGDTWRPASFRAAKSAWRELDALIATTEAEQPADGDRLTTTPLQQYPEKFEALDIPITVALYGVEYDSNRASVTDLIADRVALPASALLQSSRSRMLLTRIVRDADELRHGLNTLENDLRRCVAAAAKPWDQGDKPGDRFVHLIDTDVRQIFADAVAGDLEVLAGRWRRVAVRAAAVVADEVFASFGPRVFSGFDEQRDGKAAIRHRAATADRRWRARLYDRIGEVRDLPSEEEVA